MGILREKRLKKNMMSIPSTKEENKRYRFSFSVVSFYRNFAEAEN